MRKQLEGKTRTWVLANMEKLPVRPEVQQAREVWEGKQVRMLTPWGQWRRGKVQHIYNTGAVRVVVYQKETDGVPFAFGLQHIPLLLKLVER